LASSIKNKSDLKFIFKVVVVSAFITVIAPFILGGYGFFVGSLLLLGMDVC